LRVEATFVVTPINFMIVSVFKKILFCATFITLVVVGYLVYIALFLSPQEVNKIATVYVSAPLALESSTIIVNSIKVAFEEMNYTVMGTQIQLIVLDDGDASGGWVEERERKNAEAAALDPSAIAYIGPINSGAAKISMPILNRARIVQITPTNTWPGLTKIGFTPGEPGIFYPTGLKHFLRVCTTDDLQGPAGAQWADSLGYKKMYLVDDGEAYGAGIAKLFLAEAKKIPLVLAGAATLEKDVTDYSALAQTIIASGADLVYYGGITPNGGPELLKELRNASSSIAFMGPDGIFEADFIERAGVQNAEGLLLTAVGVPPDQFDTPQVVSFLKKYKKAYNSEPDVFGALAYEATKVIFAAVGRAGSLDRVAILDEARKTRNYPGLFGTWSFDQNGDTDQKLMSGSVVKGGEFTFLSVLEVK